MILAEIKLRKERESEKIRKLEEAQSHPLGQKLLPNTFKQTIRLSTDKTLVNVSGEKKYMNPIER